jgi:hypothetical protein
MGQTQAAQLAEQMSLTTTVTGSPLGAVCAIGALEGFPVAIAWNKRLKAGAAGSPGNGKTGRSTVTFLIRFKKGTLQVPVQTLAGQISANQEILQAMEIKDKRGARRLSMTAGPDSFRFHWDYSFRAPKAAGAATVLRALIGIFRGVATPVGNDCEVCGGTRTGELGSVNGVLISVCAGCRERMGEEDRRKIEAYEALTANPLLGTLFGLGAAAAGALLWGGIAYGLNRIFLYGGILIGVGIAWSVNKGMGKVTLYGRALTVVLTIASVLAGDFFFLWLSAASQLNEPLSLDLAERLWAHFVQIEFADSSGYVSVLFGLLGAVFILFTNRPPVARRVFVPIAQAR